MRATGREDPSPTSRSDFTRYLREAVGEPGPDDESVERCWEALSRALQTELVRRGLWSQPPRYVGIEGTSWLEGRKEGLATPFDELLADCFSYIFVDRAQSLAAHLATKVGIEGLVFRNIRNFLFERQRYHDPVGFRAFDLLRRGLSELTADGRLHASTRKLGNRTRISVASSDSAADAAPDLDTGELESLARVVFDSLFRSGDRSAVLSELVRHARKLQQSGVDGYRLGDLAAAVKALVRARWSAVAQSEIGENDGTDTPGRAPAATAPSSGFVVAQLVRCVEGLADDLGWDSQQLDRLYSVWRHFVATAVESGDTRIPSARAASRATGVPRDRIPELRRALGGLVRRCLGTDAAPSGASSSAAPVSEG